MEKLKYILFTLIIACGICSTSCIEDGFTTSSSDLLEFSCDTVAFDTIFTEVGTPTKQFIIYNRHKKMINISSISLDESVKGKFFLNVDGMKGNEFHNIEIRGEDSIYVFVESFIDVANQNNPIEVSGNINFVTNGVTQKVLLSAWGQDVVRIYGDEITADTRFTADKPYVIFDTLHIAKGATLTVDAGTTLHFHDKAALKVDGTMICNGTQSQPVHIRGDRSDFLFEGANYDIMSAQWGGIIFGEESYGNEWNYVLMRGSTIGVNVQSADSSRTALHLFNSVLHNASENVLTATNARIEAEGCEFSDAGNHVVYLNQGNYHFVNCTFVNYYIFSIIDGNIITIEKEDEEGNPLNISAKFDNCIICGRASEFNIGDFTGMDVIIRNCMLQSNGSDDDNFINCVWDGKPEFKMVRDEYIFDYRIGNESNAIALGDPSLCPAHATVDRYGVERIRNGAVDIGAYVWVYSDDENK